MGNHIRELEEQAKAALKPHLELANKLEMLVDILRVADERDERAVLWIAADALSREMTILWRLFR